MIRPLFFSGYSKLFLLAILAATASCGKSGNGAPPGGKTAAIPLAVEGFVVKSSAISGSIKSVGTLKADNETTLYPETTGRIVSMNIPEGSFVTKGTLLMKIFDGELQAQLQKVNAQLDLAEQTEQRFAQLLKVSGVSQQEYDQAALQIEVLKAEAELIKVQIAKTELRAPYDGKVGLRMLSVGAIAGPQTPVCTIRSSNDLKIDFAIPEKYGNSIGKGTNIQFTVEGDTVVHKASVAATEQSVEMDTRNLMVRAIVNSASKNLLPGAFAEVSVVMGSKSDAIMIPSQCIIPQARNKVVIVSKGGKSVFTPVKTGIRQEALVEITEGLSIGDTVATTGILFLRPDSPLTFSKIN